MDRWCSQHMDIRLLDLLTHVRAEPIVKEPVGHADNQPAAVFGETGARPEPQLVVLFAEFVGHTAPHNADTTSVSSVVTSCDPQAAASPQCRSFPLTFSWTTAGAGGRGAI